MADSVATQRLVLSVRGVVQGVGFRPFVYRAARERGLVGWVRNETTGVHIEAQGARPALDGFVEALRCDHPPQAVVEHLIVAEIATRTEEAFVIGTSCEGASPRPAIPADLATCPACLEEIRTPGERRYRYPFTNCTHCGPRYSIIKSMPYDRPRTSMKRFAMCPECAAEYDDPDDRRFHAQPIACPDCGPQLQLLDASGTALARGEPAMASAVETLIEGRTVALEGIGGFQLLVDATSDSAVTRLRERKRREAKPFAIMLPSVEAVSRCCVVSEREARVLASPEAPILLLRRRADAPAGSVADRVAPRNPYLGVMLPYTPLHHLLLDAVDRPVVCTSGNISDEPMSIDIGEALDRLGAVADLFLVHDRPIVRPVDDSVARVDGEGLQVLRRARGFAPRAIELDIPPPGPPDSSGADDPSCRARLAPTARHQCRGSGKERASNACILAVGGHLKSTVALTVGSQVVVSQHIGDLDSAEGTAVFERTIRDLVEFFDAQPDVVACDLHPDYASTRHAEKLAEKWSVPLIRVQHHHAHIASCVAEHGLDGDVLGLSWDGTGYGIDGTVWGGEALVCNGAEFRRVAHMRPFSLPGGERAIAEPRRAALGLLHEIFGEDARRWAREWFTEAELRTLLVMLDRSLNAPRTTSVGRLFDAVAALLGLRTHSGFEGHAAMEVEFAAHGATEEGAYPLPLSDGEPAVADWEPLVTALLDDLSRGAPVPQMAARFHNALAAHAVEVAERAALLQVVLSGGCFQNAYLTERIRLRLQEVGFRVYTQRKVPPNDGGIALGQVYVAAQRIADGGSIAKE